MSATPRLAMPFLTPGQAQKETYHNEALQILDALVGGCVEEPPLVSMPAAPTLGACYLVADGATGDWAGRAQSIASFSEGGWRYVAPRDGMTVYVRSLASTAVYRNGEWEIGNVRGSALVLAGQKVVGERAAPIAAPAGGAVVDGEARAAIGQILASLRQHGLIGG